MATEQEVPDRAEQIQNQFHDQADQLYDQQDQPIHYQNYTNVLIYREIARLRIQVEELQKQLSSVSKQVRYGPGECE